VNDPKAGEPKAGEPKHPGSPKEWDAATYDRVADPQFRWGLAVLDRLTVTAGATVLDAGCGSGRVTEALLERHPDSRVVALDRSTAMVEEAGRRLARFGDRVRLVVADLAEPLPVEPVDAVFSTATFHWVTDHDALFHHLAAVLGPDGRLVAQCGGAGNLARVDSVLDDLGAPARTWLHYADVAATEARLRTAGFAESSVWLAPEPTTFDDDEVFTAFLRTVILRGHLAALAPGEQDAFVTAVVAALPDRTLDYVRLNIDATRRARDRGPADAR
jgi:trans-aconitate 2-methyltransferase